MVRIVYRRRIERAGFTIVELLIVIVVIAILAAISMVAYNGIQTRAKNTAQATAVAESIKLLKAYKALNGEYPTEGGCLGNNNIDTNGDGKNDCGDNGRTVVNQILFDKLDTVGTQPTVVTDQIVGVSGVKRAGVFWERGTSRLIWFVKGNSIDDCGLQSSLALFGARDGSSIWCGTTLD
ncbi:MAG: type II secretion system protein [Candidatus Saccharimonas sp.]